MSLRAERSRFSQVLLFSALAGTVAACGAGPLTPTQGSAFAGVWQNVNAQTQSYTQLGITSTGSVLQVHEWGACSPADCDDGLATSAQTQGAQLTVTFTFAGETQTETYTLSGGQLLGTGRTHYTDLSGRPDLNFSDTFAPAQSAVGDWKGALSACAAGWDCQLQFKLTQTGNTVSGAWISDNANIDGLITGTINGSTVTMTLGQTASTACAYTVTATPSADQTTLTGSVQSSSCSAAASFSASR